MEMPPPAPTSAPSPLGRLPEEWAEIVQRWGEPAFRGRQLFRWLHARGETDPHKMTDLPAALRERLAELALAEPVELAHCHRSQDHTRKLTVGLNDGARVECVLIPMTRVQDDADAQAAATDEEDVDETGGRVTLCISTQHGCAMGCGFCASGQAGLFRGLSAAEIVSQVRLAKRHLEAGEQLKNLVFMGMGEPLHHYDATARAIRILTHPEGHSISPRRITVSTVGLVTGIRRLGEDFEGKVGLAVSLHAPDDATRDRIIPMNRRYPLKDLLAALRAYPLPRRRRITIEYTLIAGVNDALTQADALARLLRGLRVKVNLIPMNPIAAAEFQSPDAARVRSFRERLAARGLSCFVRTRRGDDVAAACGQLALMDGAVPAERLRAASRRGSGEG